MLSHSDVADQHFESHSETRVERKRKGVQAKSIDSRRTATSAGEKHRTTGDLGRSLCLRSVKDGRPSNDAVRRETLFGSYQRAVSLHSFKNC